MVLGLHSSLALRPNKRFTVRNKQKNLWNLTNTHTHIHSFSPSLCRFSPTYTAADMQTLLREEFLNKKSSRIWSFYWGDGYHNPKPKKHSKIQSRWIPSFVCECGTQRQDSPRRWANFNWRNCCRFKTQSWNWSSKSSVKGKEKEKELANTFFLHIRARLFPTCGTWFFQLSQQELYLAEAPGRSPAWHENLNPSHHHLHHHHQQLESSIHFVLTSSFRLRIAPWIESPVLCCFQF